MKTRKIFLLSAIALLAVIFVIQCIFAGRSPVKEWNLKESVDSIEITSSKGSVKLVKEGENWFVGDKKYPADSDDAEDLAEALTSIKTLGVLTRSTADESRYGLDENTKITVKGSKDGKILRTLYVGKDSSTGSQSYIKIGDSSEILLASDSYHDLFTTDTEALRDCKIFSVKAEEISNVSVEAETGSFNVAKSGDPAVWTFVPADSNGDSEKIATWVKTLNTLTADSFAPETTAFPTENLEKITLTAGDKQITVKFAKAISENPDAEEKYICSSSESDYLFYVSNYIYKKFIKNVKALQK